MPTQKRSSHRRQSRRKAAGALPMTLRLAPPSNAKYRLVYTGMVPLTEAAAGGGAYNLYNVTSPYDPDYTGIGTQPIGFDQIATMYQQFRVLRVTIRAMFENSSDTTSATVGVFMLPGTVMPTANPLAWGVQPTAVTRQIQMSKGGPSASVITLTPNIPAVLGVAPKSYKTDMDFVSTTAASPTRSAYACVFVHSRTAIVASVAVQVSIAFEVLASQPVPLGLS